MGEDFDFTQVVALLDTNILSSISKGKKRALKFAKVFDFMADNLMTPMTHWSTKFEFIGYSGNKYDYEKLTDFISPFVCLPQHKESNEVEIATLLSSIYKNTNPNISPKQISFTDCLQAAQLLRYKNKLAVVTTDINDYPNNIFDMPHIIPIEEENGVTMFVGFKTFNQAKWEAVQKHFNATGGKKRDL